MNTTDTQDPCLYVGLSPATKACPIHDVDHTTPVKGDAADLVEAAEHQARESIATARLEDWTTHERYTRYIAALAVLRFTVTGPKQVMATGTDAAMAYLGQEILDYCSAQLDMPPGEFTGTSTNTVFTWL